MLTSSISQDELQQGVTKQVESLIYNSILVADALLRELYDLGYDETQDEEPADPSIQSLADILKKSHLKSDDE